MANLSKLNKLRQMNQSSRQFIIIFPSFSLIMVAAGTYRGKIIYTMSIASQVFSALYNTDYFKAALQR